MREGENQQQSYVELISLFFYQSYTLFTDSVPVHLESGKKPRNVSGEVFFLACK